MYRIVHHRDYIAIEHINGDVVETFDHNEYRDAELLLKELIEMKVFTVSYLIARGKWVSQGGKRDFVPAEEFQKRSEKVQAPTKEVAVTLVLMKDRASAIIRDIRAE